MHTSEIETQPNIFPIEEAGQNMETSAKEEELAVLDSSEHKERNGESDNFSREQNAEYESKKNEIIELSKKKLEQLRLLKESIEAAAGENTEIENEIKNLETQLSAIKKHIDELAAAGERTDTRSVTLGMAEKNKNKPGVFSKEELENELNRTITTKQAYFSARKKDAFLSKIPLGKKLFGSPVQNFENGIIAEMAHKERAVLFEERVALNSKIRSEEAEQASKEDTLLKKKALHEQKKNLLRKNTEAAIALKRDLDTLENQLNKLVSLQES